MPALKTIDLKAKADADLKEILADERQALFRLKLQAATGHTAIRNHQIKEHRRNVARVLTLLTERERAVAAQPAVAPDGQ